MRRAARGLLMGVLALDAVFVLLFLIGGPAAFGAETDNAASGEAVEEDADAAWTREALERLGQELETRAAELERREEELEELIRGNDVLRESGLLGEDGRPAEDAEPEPEPVQAPEEPSANSEAFERLQKAFENMEPESAAQAMSQLADKDKDAVVALVLGWPPRTSGSILDALTQLNPALSAELSYEIWSLSGKKGSAAAGNGR